MRVSVFVCVGVGVRCLVRLCVSAYCLPCRHGDDIMAHDCRMTERIPPRLLCRQRERQRERGGGEIGGVMKEGG